MKQAIINQTFLTIPLAIFDNYLRELSGQKFSPEMPTFYRIVKDLIAFFLLRESLYYYVHRLLHHPKIYKYIHKRHHEWKTPIALASFYSHPLEHFLVNLVPVYLGMKSFETLLEKSKYWKVFLLM